MNENSKRDELIDAVRNGAADRVKRLLDEGCDVNVADDEERPLLLVAIRSGAEKGMAELLLERGADIGWTTAEGVGLLDEAVERNRLDLAELFIDRGLDPALTRRRSGMTPLMLAASFDYIEMMELLYEKGADIFAVDELGLSAVDYARKLGRRRAKKWLDDKMANPF
ncbi:ankyrin repeat [Hydrogenimonas sp.]|nr:ankyrin repeat [Hydrogenimonas sp.]